MRAICGLFALLIMLGPIGMGIMLNVDSPQIGEVALSTNFETLMPEDHGTKSVPSEGAMFVDVFLRTGLIMNTTAPTGTGTTSAPGTYTFSLQKALAHDYKIENPSPGFPMMATVTLLGGGDCTITVRDGAGGPTVGTGSREGFNFGFTPTEVDINIPFESVTNYTFSAGRQIEVDIILTSTASLVYGGGSAQSKVQFYGYTLTDISVNTKNFFDWATDRFYPNDINSPDDRKKVTVEGVVSEVFSKDGALQYVNLVEVRIEGPSYDEIRTASYDKSEFSYKYSWSYPTDQNFGLYTITTIVTDEQSNQFTVQGFFNMSQYGVILTSPSQKPEEGSFQANAEKNLIQKSLTTYEINVHNRGGEASGFHLNATTSLSGWDYWFEQEGFDSWDNKSGGINSIEPGGVTTIKLVVDAKNNDIGEKARVDVIAVSSIEPSEEFILKTVSEIKQRYAVELDFTETSLKELDKELETGDSVQIDFTVENTGGVEGSDDTVNLELSAVPAGWTLSLEGDQLQGAQGNYHVVLPSNAKTDPPFTLTIVTPVDRGDEEVSIEIKGVSQGSAAQGDNPAASDSLTVNVETSSGLSFILNDLIEKDVDPEDTQRFDFRLENTGTKLANFTVSFSGLPSSDGWEQQDASFDEFGYVPTLDYNNLAPSNPRDFSLYIEPSLDVLAKNYTIQIHVENRDQPTSKFANQHIFIIVNEEFRVEIVDPRSLEIFGEAQPGDVVEYSIIIENNGNVEERVTVSVDLPGGWEVDFGNDSSDWIEDLAPGDEETIPVVLTVPDDAQGDETVDITISIIPAKSDVIQVVTHTKIEQTWYQPLMTLIVPLLLFVVILAMVIVIYKKR
jgi:uncharacterized membrane protein